MRNLLTPLAAAAGLLAAGAAHAQSAVTTEPAAVQGGVYVLEPYHTQVGFSVLHMGFSRYDGVFANASGQLRLDPKTLEASALEVTVPVASVQTTNTTLTGELKGAQWLDAAKFPTMQFRATRITRTGPAAATVAGELTLHGVTRPVVLKARFIGAGVNPIDKSYTAGFAVSGVIKRSEFGVTTYVPMISDEVELSINAAFHKAP